VQIEKLPRPGSTCGESGLEHLVEELFRADDDDDDGTPRRRTPS
jgi:hypothetical protein